MLYNEILAERIKKLLSEYNGITERKMFGGLAFLIKGNMFVAVSCKGGILVRVDPNNYEALSKEAGVEVAVMRAKKMNGWLLACIRESA